MINDNDTYIENRKANRKKWLVIKKWKGVSYLQSCHSMTGEKRLMRRKVEDRLEEEVWGSLKKKRLEESEVEGKLLEVKLAENVVLALRFEDEVVEKGPMTTVAVAVAVAVEDMVSSFRVYSSPIPADYCCNWVSFPRCLMNEIVNHKNYFGVRVIFHVCTWWWIRAHSNSSISFR